jgi:hypothetical protein
MKNELRHVGVLGMKWGRRKGGGGISRGSSASRASADHTKAAGLKKKRLSEMSNEELAALTKRLQLEKQYKDLTRGDVSAGKKFVSEILQSAGKQVASKYVASALEGGGTALVEILKKKAG